MDEVLENAEAMGLTIQATQQEEALTNCRIG